MNSAQTPSPVNNPAQPKGAIQPQTQPGQVTAPKPPDPSPTVAEVMKVCPDADISNVRNYLPLILKAMATDGLISKNQLVAIIATIHVETTPFAPIPEYGRGAGLGYAPYYGRGFIQLTHLTNYQAASKKFGIDLVGKPDLALKPDLAAKILTWFWKGNTGNNPSIPAEKGDWRGVRLHVNGGYRHLDKFLGAVERGLQVFKSGIDPKAIGSIPLDGSYGLGCADPGIASSRTLTGVHNPTTQADALSYALGLHLRERDRSHKFDATLNLASVPEVLELDAQKTFEVKGFGTDLDGTFTTDEIVFYPLDERGLIAELHAFKPDPNAPPVQAFLHDSQAGLNPAQSNIISNVPAGEIPQKIYQAALSNKGRSSAAGPGGGNVACAWCVNKYAIAPAGLKPIGSNTDYVPSMVEALDGGRGKKVDPSQAVPGDIWISYDMAHVGICTTQGCTRVLSNSSSRAAFAWEDARSEVDSYYGGSTQAIYRVVN
ncbi:MULTISPECIES: glycoside hydrolase family 19 protein [Trichocoleus]|uniref:Glycoside hydrolase family 19 catalytic domain-containing protein n=1 Tax=Trichocoleus desertorum GB2-A4 TaxID=2933944 RepID=A0ABV0JCT4_9CYAN|nr:glycoside hydrolase family 19 protein [Trichocoleus sp. FACHB-46]MBD1864237.1 hypothetical protein [Trichocoleus sp. FACHB-46]